MNNSHFAKLRGFFLAISSFSVLSASAQLEQGKVYRFVNVQYPGYSLCASSLTTVGGGQTLEDSKTQLWYVDTRTDGSANTYRLRNLRTGKYMKGGGNERWRLTDEDGAANTFLYLLKVGAADQPYYTLSTNTSTGGVNKMHCDASYNIVGWSTDAQATQWTVTEVEAVGGETIDEDWLAANWAEVNNFPPSDEVQAGYQAALDALFTDKACTTLKASYSSESALEADANYRALPQALRAMVKKIWKAGNGTSVAEAWKESHVSGNEALAWSGDYARRFRVQLYEPYTERECTNAALRINIHTNLNNPTGIFAGDGDLLYVMVDREVPAGASLYLGAYEGHGQAGNYNDGTELHQGLNVIPFWKQKMWTCIYYTVPTLKAWDGTTNKTQYDLTQFPDLKIHIEGGHINGFYNAVGDDLWAHDAATQGCDEGKNLSAVATTLTDAHGGKTPENANLMQTNCVFPKGDNEADWDYLTVRNVMPDVTILGRYMVFQFYHKSPESDHPEYSTSHWFDKPDGGTRLVRIPEWIERWDRIMMSERLTMGLLSKEEMAEANARFHAQDATKHDIYTYTGDDAPADFGCDYSRHYRMHGLAISNNSGYMSGGWTSSNYHYNTLSGIIGELMDMTNAGGPAWGPGHEIGHQHQGPFNMRGLTEVTNNLYSNIAVWYDGRGTSRVNGGEGDLTEVLKAYNQTPHDFFTNNIWAQTHMYYKLWLYYHLVGKNTKFYPRLMEMLRRDPMTIGYDQQGNTSLLHFYKKACDAAEEDLTEFFRAYGFFEVMDHRFVGDYSSAEYTQTQADIDAAIASVKAKGYPENTNVLFINDCTAGATYLNHEGEPRKLWDGKTYSDLGSYTVLDGTDPAPVTGDYTLSVGNGQVTLGGATGGMGFLIYDEDGKLLAFSSDKTFPVSDELELAMAKGTATVAAMPAEGEPVEVAYDPEAAAVSLLQGMLETAKAELDKKKDDGGADGNSYTRPGCYKSNRPAYVALVEKYESAREVLDGGNVASYTAAYTALRQAYEALLADEFALVPLVAGNKYYIRCVGRGNTYMYAGGENKVCTSTTLPESHDAYLWTFEAAGEDGKYYLKNGAGEGLYVQDVTANKNAQFALGATKAAFTVSVNGTGQFNIYTETARTYLNAAANNGNVVSWDDANDNNGKWTFELAEADALAANSTALREAARQTRELMDRVASVRMKGPQDMSLLRLTSNATEQGHGTELLVDGNAETFFHTCWTGSGAVTEPHHILIDCVDDGLDLFTLNWITTSTNYYVDAPKTVVVQATNETVNGEPANFKNLTTLSWEDSANPLPIAKGQVYTSAEIGTAGTPYRFIRLQVTAATGGNWGNYPYFGLAELGLTRTNSRVTAIRDAYADALTAEQIHDIANDIADALNTDFTDADEVATRLAQMQAYYRKLQDACGLVADAELQPARQALQALLDKTQALMAECGTVETVTPTIKLQSTDANASGYLWCNAPYTAQQNGDYSVQGTDGYHLLDGDINTYLHTDYSDNAPAGDHYLRVYMGAEGLDRFSFTYTNRNFEYNLGNPTAIVVEGSNEADGDYTPIATITSTADNPMPINSADSQGKSYQSQLLGSKGVSYPYIRFRVTKTKSGNRWFYMSEFGMQGAPRYQATLSTDKVSADLLIATEKERSSAATALNMAGSVAQLAAAQAALQAAYDALYAAAHLGETLNVKVTDYRYAGFYAAWPVAVPEGLRAFYVKQGDVTEQSGDEAGHAALTEITGIIPANTGVVLYGEPKDYEMVCTDEPAEPVAGNMLRGCATETYVKAQSGTNYYLFGAKGGEVGLYQAWLQYNADGTVTPGNENTDNGGHFRVSANKIYMPFAGTGEASAFRFSFDAADGIHSLSPLPADAAIRDLSGRRISRITRPGLYIVGGRKQVVGKQSTK